MCSVAVRWWADTPRLRTVHRQRRTRRLHDESRMLRLRSSSLPVDSRTTMMNNREGRMLVDRNEGLPNGRSSETCNGARPFS
ncbi:hypothetical protein PHSY_000478 [Pseudozyma hubeiensis SY62]|uniref:Uncharacterized protein n=1 Tax=Pseudozyma hubeiensis (strain SY62) TaxID=1305764 RepID=R9NWK9_PSEHS|nr:hypothetical protein PHSY_000478 [Pseudozyma hubeiensis SY62]GAC92919.1 hypothetical protein PHSY_000478 [Pseudozyma hubeiensis SY62]